MVTLRCYVVTGRFDEPSRSRFEIGGFEVCSKSVGVFMRGCWTEVKDIYIHTDYYLLILIGMDMYGNGTIR